MAMICVKDGSWNSMISAQTTGQIFIDLVICPYCSMGEEYPYFPKINPYTARSKVQWWADTPWKPNRSLHYRLKCHEDWVMGKHSNVCSDIVNGWPNLIDSFHFPIDNTEQYLHRTSLSLDNSDVSESIYSITHKWHRCVLSIRGSIIKWNHVKCHVNWWK